MNKSPIAPPFARTLWSFIQSWTLSLRAGTFMGAPSSMTCPVIRRELLLVTRLAKLTRGGR